MDNKVYILSLSTVSIELVELIIGEILPVIVDDFNVSLSVAG